MSDNLLAVINEVRANKHQSPLLEIIGTQRLREDLGFDSLDLAELTSRIDAKFCVDVFEDGLVSTVGEVAAKLRGKQRPQD